MRDFQLIGGESRRIHGLRGSADLYVAGGLADKVVLVTAHEKDIVARSEHLRAFRPDARVLQLPPLDGLPFSFMAIHPSTRRTRLMTLDALVQGDWDVLVTTAQSLIEPLAPRERLAAPRLFCRAGDDYDLNGLARSLAEMGYSSVDVVSQPGDFAKRGGILDVYSFADDRAFRLEFFDAELEEIRVIDPSTQRGTGNVDEAVFLPMFEWSIGEAERDVFGRKGGALWNHTEARDHFLELVSRIRDHGRFPGYLHWSRFFFDNCTSLPELLGPVTYFVDDADAVSETHGGFLSHMELQREAMGDSYLFAPLEQVYGLPNPRRIPVHEDAQVYSHQQLKLDAEVTSYSVQSVPQYRNDIERFFEHWRPQARRQAILVICHNRSLMARLQEALEAEGVTVKRIEDPSGESFEPGFYLSFGRLNTGFAWPDRNLVVFSEDDIWSNVAKTTSRPRVEGKKIFQQEFRDLKIGDYVVHLDHGIGRFLGLVEMQAGGDTHEMMAIEYRDKQRLYVHLNQLNLVQRFGSENATVQLDRMGGVSWAKAKARVRKAVRQMAEDLLKLYAEREVVSGLTYSPDNDWQVDFEERFEHEPTEGQLRAVAEIKKDLGKPMDRLLVGDVGFGKTEVAMRMAFKVATDGYQVAVLCPTTVLAFQHAHTFRNRFEGFPIIIRWISRFTPAKEAKQILKDTSEGKVDILIGTHRLLGKDVTFHRLGAVVVDEEQRFGVGHKEKLKLLRKQIDVLSMSATPIPRTLHMAMSGVRDISIIESPPRNRLAINTMVAESREDLIRNAIEFELERGGQVFFIHNRVETMEDVAGRLKSMVPRAEIAMAHGQMDSKHIEKVMLAFMERKFDVLVASTIIENGIDIPNANTMIVNRADMFGMSQLYQLRGRIGRSDRPAYAYLLIPSSGRMTDLARKRLATLEEFSDLGSGFRIAAMDMELRGAGNMLGGEQAGHINTIGFDLYVKLLEEAVRELKGETIEDEIHCAVNLNFGAALPKTYISETNQRLSYYKRLSAAKDEAALREIRETLEDCYGAMPSVTETLYREQELRLNLSQQKVLQAEREGDKVRLKFHESAEVHTDLVLDWVRSGRDVGISPEGVITLPTPSREPGAVMTFIRETVDALVGAR